MRRQDIRALFIQIREDTKVKQEEYFQFLRRAHLNPMQVAVWDVFVEPYYPYKNPEGFDCILIGGSSDDPEDKPYFEPEHFPFINPLLEFVRTAIQKKVPILASCMGFEILVQALGGEVVIDLENKEVGTPLVTLTDAGKHDPLLSSYPEEFPALSWHIKRASKLPDNTTPLVYSERCPYHAFKIVDAPVYAFQFHPEMNRFDLYSRLLRYHEKYGIQEDEFDDLEGRLQDTDVANTILDRFINIVVCNGVCEDVVPMKGSSIHPGIYKGK